MMESILNRRKSMAKGSVASISIEILPEYGWSVGSDNNERVFGPGTLFRGYVVVNCKELSERASRLHLLFQGSESMLAYDIGLGAMRSSTIQFFKVHRTLWKKVDALDVLKPMNTYKFLFTIQMPLVQFPPSMSHDFYKCTFKLSAYLYPSLEFGKMPVVAQLNIQYIPCIETRVPKSPIYLQDVKKKKEEVKSSSMVELSSTEFVSGDTIKAVIHVRKASDTTMSPISDILNVVLCLYQISTFQIDEEPISERLIETQTHIIRTHTSGTGQYRVSLKLNESLLPSFTYGKVMCLSYKLKIKIYVKKSKVTNGLENNNAENSIHYNDDTKKSLKKYLVLPWSSAVSVFESPIVIGTMGRGIRADDQLRVYTGVSSRPRNALYIPSFIQDDESEDMLPKYEASRLPSYSASFGTSSRVLLMTASSP
ncbi:hypothetical protein EDC94DRAFT_626742 [Helicostylum pulchrum]|uniref:Arrestin C-terminal-like domain-containing protein n=1 Tax=Helicostylum pulchrum TaxID=562976 RepID=A0ABP9YHA4_9FUNG|nr:hypothetical protein EDC94DRAFT_626742 [Helicostylum pulchrum]